MTEQTGEDLAKSLITSVGNVAMVAHEVNRAYCKALGDDSQPDWEGAPEWQKKSAMDGVMFHMKHPHAAPSASHENWMLQKEREGWEYGETKDQHAKTHPCMVPYDALPLEQRVKDYLFIAVVRSLASL